MSRVEELKQRRLIQEANRVAIFGGWEKLCSSINSKGKMKKPVHIILSGDKLNLCYKTETDFYQDGEKKVLRSINISLNDNEHVNPISEREFTFYEHNDLLVEVNSFSFTAPKNESKGYGSALLLLSNKVIEDAISRYADLKDPNIIAVISDSAKSNGFFGDGLREDGSFISRSGWTSFFAFLLEYSRYQYTNIWYKVYRENPKFPIDLDQVLTE